MPKFWIGSAPANCDICHEAIDDTFTDGATRYGPWANMCPHCHAEHGRGLGVGRGQTYHRTVDGHWVQWSVPGYDGGSGSSFDTP